MTCCKQVGEITPHFPDQFVPQQGASGASRRSGSSTAWAVSLDPQLSSLRWTICPSASSLFHFWTIFPFTQPPVRNNTKTSILMFNVDDRIWTSFCWLRQQDAHLWSSSFPGGGIVVVMFSWWITAAMLFSVSSPGMIAVESAVWDSPNQSGIGQLSVFRTKCKMEVQR